MTYEDLTQDLISTGVLRTERIIAAWRAVDRSLFVPIAEHENSYLDIPLPLGYGATISQPYTVATMLEFLQPQIGDHCLDVGAGSGWTAALLGRLVGSSGSVIAVELIPQLKSAAKKALHQAAIDNVEYFTGDASLGWPNKAPYHIIHVAAAAKKIPDELKKQLNIGGRMIIPIGEYVQDLVLIKKIEDNKYTERNYPGFQFVPLVSSLVG